MLLAGADECKGGGYEVFATTDTTHPGVNYLLNQTNPVYVSGRLEGVEAPVHYDFRELRRTPAELRGAFCQQYAVL